MSDNVIVRVPEQQFIRGEDGYSPEVTIENINHGHSVTITDRDHPTGQSFNVMDGDSAYEQAVAGGYTGTEAQFNEELASFKTLSEQAADSANTAAGAAFRAQNYERHAGDAEDAARAYADIALIRMNSADASAQEASASATAASQAEGNAANSATAAAGSASTASTAATTAQGHATNAASSATAASGSATAAASSATAAGNAQTAAETAQGAAEDAQAAAEAVLASIPADYTELTEDVDDLKSQIKDGGAYNVIVGAIGTNGGSGGITWTWNENGSVTVEGENASSVSTRTLAGSSTTFPQDVNPGDKLYVIYSSEKVKLNFLPYVDGVTSPNTSFVSNGEYIVPEDATGLVIRYLVSKNTSNVHETVRAIILTEPSNKMLKEGIEGLKEKDDALADNTLQLNATDRPWVGLGDDLNNYTTAGQWLVPSAQSARQLLNKPVDFNSTGIIDVINTHNTNHVYQLIFSNDGTNIWARHIRIEEGIYDEWYSLRGASGYSWQKRTFLIHDPIEEARVIVDVVKEYSDINITEPADWTRPDDQGNRIISASAIYAMWDRLQAEYPEYIDVGETIGYSRGPNSENYAPIKAYYIHPRKSYVNWSGNTVNINYREMPTLYLTAGTHGGESSPTWNLLEVFRRAFMTGTIYSAFLAGLQFRVVPVLDVWSYDNFKRYLAAAYNADGTQKVSDSELELYNCNRQCVCTDMSSPTYNSLTLRSFASEAEALTNYLNTHNFGSVAGDSYVDLHNCSYSLGYLTTDKPAVAHMFNIMMDELAKDWYNNTTFANGDKVDYYASSTSDHSRQRGDILAQEPIASSYAWFFGKAYPSYSSNILEVQQADSSSANGYSFAKGLDMTYRWLKTLIEKIKLL